MSTQRPLCTGCNKHPEDIPEYNDPELLEGLTPEQFVRMEEGTYNAANGHFLCSECYVKAGCPSSPRGWIAP